MDGEAQWQPDGKNVRDAPFAVERREADGGPPGAVMMEGMSFNPTALTDAEITALLEPLESEETTVSRRRRSVHDQIDFISAGGGASAEMAEAQLASLRTKERTLSIRRRALHLQIDLLRAERSQRPA